MDSSDLVPWKFREAHITDEAALHWAREAAAGRPTSLLVLGPHWSGKTYAAYATLNEALLLGLPRSETAAVPAWHLGWPGAVESLERRVALLDPIDYGDPEYNWDTNGQPDYTDAVRVGQEQDEPDVQAAMALEAGRLRLAVERLAFSTHQATLFTATSEHTLARTFGDELAAELLRRPLLRLAARERPPMLEWG